VSLSRPGRKSKGDAVGRWLCRVSLCRGKRGERPHGLRIKKMGKKVTEPAYTRSRIKGVGGNLARRNSRGRVRRGNRGRTGGKKGPGGVEKKQGIKKLPPSLDRAPGGQGVRQGPGGCQVRRKAVLTFLEISREKRKEPREHEW